MPGQVEFRLGSIFDEPCDLLVIPSSVGGTVTPEIQAEIRKAGLPFPGAMRRGISLITLPATARWKAVAYAAVVAGQTASPQTVEEIGRELGKVAAALRFSTVGAPLLGAGSGDVAPDHAASALMRGFMSMAPRGTVMVISIRNPDRLEALAQLLPNAVGKHIRRPQETPADPTLGATTWRLGREPAPAVAATSSAPSPAAASARKGVFISYSHADAEWLERLQKHLKPLQREGIEVWDDTRLKPGEPWREEIRAVLAAAKIAILLISADFLASDFIVTDELPPLLKAAADEGTIILPVIVSASRFDRMENLSRFQAVNALNKPLVKMRRANQEEVLDNVARAVEDALKR